MEMSAVEALSGLRGNTPERNKKRGWRKRYNEEKIKQLGRIYGNVTDKELWWKGRRGDKDVTVCTYDVKTRRVHTSSINPFPKPTRNPGVPVLPVPSRQIARTDPKSWDLGVVSLQEGLHWNSSHSL